MAPLDTRVLSSQTWNPLNVESYGRAHFRNDGFVGCRLKPDRRKTPRYRLVQGEGTASQCGLQHESPTPSTAGRDTDLSPGE